MWRPRTLLLVLVCLLAATMAGTASANPVQDRMTAPGRGPVVLVGVPDLLWQDLDPAVTPTLWRLADRSSIGALTDRSGEGAPHRAAGWITVNTGSRAVAGVDANTVPDPAVPAELEALRAANASGRYRVQVGALGDALHGAGLTVAAVGGRGAVLGGMDGDGAVDARAGSVAAALRRADVAVMELPLLYTAGRQDPVRVRAALAAIDDRVGTVLQELPENASLLVAGVSDADGAAHLHVAMATGPSFGAGQLTSASTGRAGVVQLIDVGPTILWLSGVPVPSAMLGQHWSTVPAPGTSTAEQVSAFVDLDRRSGTVIEASLWYYPAIAWTAFLYVAVVLIVWWRRWSTGFLRPLSAVVAAVPVGSFLAQLVPWWRAGTWPLAPLTAGFAAGLGMVAAFSPWARRTRWHTAAVVAAVTAAVIVADAATGSPLSLDGPFADNPIIAGRFHGVGNVAFALLGAGTLIAAAAIAAGRGPRRAAAAVFGLGAGAVAVDGLPALGDDFGGVLALLPAVAVLGLVVSRVRLDWRHVLAVLAATVVTAAGFALYDYSRPPALRTHLGRFVGQIADGSAGAVIGRKLDASLATVTDGLPRWIVVGWIVLAVAAALGRRRGRLRVVASVDSRTAGGLLAALLVLAVLGAALNDSGLAIVAFAFYLAAPLLVLLVEPVPEPLPSSASPREAGSAELRRP